MNEWDKNNFSFLMNTSEKTFSEWMLQADTDDIDYALELMSKHRSEMIYKEILLKENTDSVIDTTEANLILKQFRI